MSQPEITEILGNRNAGFDAGASGRWAYQILRKLDRVVHFDPTGCFPVDKWSMQFVIDNTFSVVDR